jgi:hypothetical protein
MKHNSVESKSEGNIKCAELFKVKRERRENELSELSTDTR